jgi:hypothetical protein
MKQPLWTFNNFKFKTYENTNNEQEDELTKSLYLRKSEPIPLNLMKSEKNAPKIQESIIKAIITPLKKVENPDFQSTSLSPRESMTSYIHKPLLNDLVNHDEIINSSLSADLVFDEPMLNYSLMLEEIKPSQVVPEKKNYQYFQDLDSSVDEKNDFSSLQEILNNQKNVNSFTQPLEEPKSEKKIPEEDLTKSQMKVEVMVPPPPSNSTSETKQEVMMVKSLSHSITENDHFKIESEKKSEYDEYFEEEDDEDEGPITKD